MPYLRGIGDVTVTVPDFVNPCRPVSARFVLFTDAGSVGMGLIAALGGKL